MLGNGVPYVALDLADELQMALGARVAVTPSALAPLLWLWSSQPHHHASEEHMAGLLKLVCG